jgi:dienelactone hydrolase
LDRKPCEDEEAYLMSTCRASILAALALGGAILTSPASAQEQITLPGPGGVTLTAALYKPSGSGPFPAVVALHGCAGLSMRGGQPSARHHDWGERLAAQGFLVVMPDSFASRGLGSQCQVRQRDVRASGLRVDDAHAARLWLQGRADVKASAVSLLGWSNGASSVLYAVKTGSKVAGRDFARAVAFYPGCRVPARDGYGARVPLFILMGGADNWTPPEPCRELVEKSKGKGARVDYKEYPGAVHDFDHPNLPIRTRTGLAYTGSGTGEAQLGTDPAARADSLSRVPAYLAR